MVVQNKSHFHDLKYINKINISHIICFRNLFKRSNEIQKKKEKEKKKI